MRANYGYMDGSGEYFITIDTDCCEHCNQHGCIVGCPKGIFEIITDDYEEQVAAVKEEFRKSLKYVCAECKPSEGWVELPCQIACGREGIFHSW